MSWFLVNTCWLLVIKSWFLVITSWLLVIKSWFLVITSWLLVIKSWFPVITSWLLVSTSWFLVISSPELAQGELLGYRDVRRPSYVWTSVTSETYETSVRQLFSLYTL